MIATLRATARVVKIKGDEYLASQIDQAADRIAALERQLAEKQASIEEMRPVITACYLKTGELPSEIWEKLMEYEREGRMR